MMNVCPNCSYSTFTDEMFDVCPKCGLKGSAYREKKLQKEESEQLARDQERLQRGLRPDDFVQPPPTPPEPEAIPIPQPIRYTGWGILAVSAFVAFYGIFGLADYYGKDLYAKLNETELEPVSHGEVFFRYGLLPWLLTLYGLAMACLVSQFLRQKGWTLKKLEWGAWCGLAIGAGYEIVDYIAYIRRSSDNPSIMYYLIGLVNSLFMCAIWVALPLALIWWLRGGRVTDEFPDGE